MKFSINQSEIARAVSTASKGVSTRSTLPVLSGILVEASGDEVVFQATDLEQSIRYRVAALVEEEGATVIPGKLAGDIVKNLPDAAVTVETDGTSATISCASSTFSVNALDPADFPSFPEVDVSQTVEIPFDAFSSMVRRVGRVVSRDESRAILTGILVTVEGEDVRMVATDSYRLAVGSFSLPAPAANGFEAVISGSFMSGIASLDRSEDPVSVSLSENQIVVSYQSTVFVSRRIEGKFPNYRQLLPSSHALRVGMNREKLSAAVKRASVLGSPSSPIRFDISVASRTVQLSIAQQDVGSAREIVSCTGEGADIEIAFNCSYVLDGLSAVGTETVYLEAVSPTKPGIFMAGERDRFLYLVMPVRVS